MGHGRTMSGLAGMVLLGCGSGQPDIPVIEIPDAPERTAATLAQRAERFCTSMTMEEKVRYVIGRMMLRNPRHRVSGCEQWHDRRYFQDGACLSLALTRDPCVADERILRNGQTSIAFALQRPLPERTDSTYRLALMYAEPAPAARPRPSIRHVDPPLLDAAYLYNEDVLLQPRAFDVHYTGPGITIPCVDAFLPEKCAGIREGMLREAMDVFCRGYQTIGLKSAPGRTDPR